ncbi:UNVERIFIED_CONTAM: hypothetical protein FKN15_048176 [Acipenser sinensis]
MAGGEPMTLKAAAGAPLLPLVESRPGMVRGLALLAWALVVLALIAAAAEDCQPHALVLPMVEAEADPALLLLVVVVGPAGTLPMVVEAKPADILSLLVEVEAAAGTFPALVETWAVNLGTSLSWAVDTLNPPFWALDVQAPPTWVLVPPLHTAWAQQFAMRPLLLHSTLPHHPLLEVAASSSHGSVPRETR